jgi:hypothetical protein
MKTIRNIFPLLVLFFGFNSCMDQYTEVFTANSPVYLSYEDLREAVKTTSANDLVNPGKIYFKDGYIFVNEEMKGIHIIDNRNPRSPQNLRFIEIPGNVDMAIKNNILYADSYVDMVAIDISDIANPKEVNRIKDVFPYLTPKPENEDYRLASVDKEKGVVIDWEVKKVRQEIEYYYYPTYRIGQKCRWIQNILEEVPFPLPVILLELGVRWPALDYMMIIYMLSIMQLCACSM